MFLSPRSHPSAQLPSHLLSCCCLPQSPQPRPGTHICSSPLSLGPRLAEASYSPLQPEMSPSRHPAGEQQGLDSASFCAGESGTPDTGDGVGFTGAAPRHRAWKRTGTELEENLEVLPSGSWFPQSLVCVWVPDPAPSSLSSLLPHPNLQSFC